MGQAESRALEPAGVETGRPADPPRCSQAGSGRKATLAALAGPRISD
jgi:hypothetical protein